MFGHEEADVNVISYLLKLLPEKRHLQIDRYLCPSGVLFVAEKGFCASIDEKV